MSSPPSVGDRSGLYGGGKRGDAAISGDEDSRVGGQLQREYGRGAATHVMDRALENRNVGRVFMDFSSRGNLSDQVYLLFLRGYIRERKNKVRTSSFRWVGSLCEMSTCSSLPADLFAFLNKVCPTLVGLNRSIRIEAVAPPFFHPPFKEILMLSVFLYSCFAEVRRLCDIFYPFIRQWF